MDQLLVELLEFALDRSWEFAMDQLLVVLLDHLSQSLPPVCILLLLMRQIFRSHLEEQN